MARKPTPKAAAPRKKAKAGANYLPDQVKVFIVARYATFHSATDIQKEVKEEYGLELEIGRIDFYNGDRQQFRKNKMAIELQDVFAKIRADYLDEIERVPIAHRAHRLKLMNDIVMTQIKKGDRANAPLVLKALEQAAREVGNQFTNAVEVKGRVAHSHRASAQADEEDVTPEERENVVTQRIQEAIQKMAAERKQAIH